MANVFTEVNTALQTALEAITGIPDVQRENKRARAGAVTPWVRFTMIPSKTVITTVGLTGISEQNGVAHVDIFYPISTGSDAARETADIIINAFKVGNRYTSNGVTVEIRNAYPLGTMTLEQSYMLPVIIDWSTWNSR